MGENRQCNIECKSDEGKGWWHKPSMQAMEVRISGTSWVLSAQANGGENQWCKQTDTLDTHDQCKDFGRDPRQSIGPHHFISIWSLILYIA
jgi:hypothetical protein